MFRDIWKFVEDKLEDAGEEQDFDSILDLAARKLYEIMISSEEEDVAKLNSKTEGFNKRNYKRWETGFRKLQALQNVSIEAGMEFQRYFNNFPEFEKDPLLHVLMIQHAHACRITGEIILLLKGGYPDGALARWRSLFEILITCLVVNKYGNEAAEDYIRHGCIKAIEGMEEYQKTSEEMNVQPYEDDEITSALDLKEYLAGGEKYFHWARKYTGVSKLEKLREHVGYEKWSHNYKLASRNVHADFRSMRSLFAMGKAAQDMLLVGPSNGGMVEPAHMTAITLTQITSVFLSAHFEEKNELNFKDSLLFLSLLNKYKKDVGEEFLKCHNKKEFSS